MNRGDTFEWPIVINCGTDLNPKQYNLQDGDKIYVGIMEPHQSFEDALIRKVITKDSPVDCRGYPLLILNPEDTEYVLTGKYFIMIKLYQPTSLTSREKVTTILPMKEFFITGTDKHISDKNFITHTISLSGEDVPEWEPI